MRWKPAFKALYNKIAIICKEVVKNPRVILVPKGVDIRFLTSKEYVKLGVATAGATLGGALMAGGIGLALNDSRALIPMAGMLTSGIVLIISCSAMSARELEGPRRRFLKKSSVKEKELPTLGNDMVPETIELTPQPDYRRRESQKNSKGKQHYPPAKH